MAGKRPDATLLSSAIRETRHARPRCREGEHNVERGLRSLRADDDRRVGNLRIEAGELVPVGKCRHPTMGKRASKAGAARGRMRKQAFIWESHADCGSARSANSQVDHQEPGNLPGTAVGRRADPRSLTLPSAGAGTARPAGPKGCAVALSYAAAGQPSCMIALIAKHSRPQSRASATSCFRPSLVCS